MFLSEAKRSKRAMPRGPRRISLLFSPAPLPARARPPGHPQRRRKLRRIHLSAPGQQSLGPYSNVPKYRRKRVNRHNLPTQQYTGTYTVTPECSGTVKVKDNDNWDYGICLTAECVSRLASAKQCLFSLLDASLAVVGPSSKEFAKNIVEQNATAKSRDQHEADCENPSECGHPVVPHLSREPPPPSFHLGRRS